MSPSEAERRKEMNSIKFVIGLNSKKEYNKGHFGDSSTFRVYESSLKSAPRLIEEITNEDKDFDKGHDSSEKLSAVKLAVKSANVAIAYTKSPNFKKMAAESKIQPIVIKRENESEVVDVVAANLRMIIALSAKRNSGVREKAIPKL